MIKKKPIRTSNLAMRFYVHDGWTKEELDSLCVRGEVKCFHPDDRYPYFTLDHNQASRFDAEKLLERTSEIDRAFPDQEVYSDLELIHHFNW